MSNYSIWISGVALVISAFSFINAWLARKQSKNDAFIKLKLNVLKELREMDIAYAAMLREINELIKEIKTNAKVATAAKELLDGLESNADFYRQCQSDTRDHIAKVFDDRGKLTEKNLHEYSVILASELARLNKNSQIMQENFKTMRDKFASLPKV
ncbi:hypothetical protein [Serratia oryzae]|uniref:Uncharacterized protein n=1 Tax=Serratia oryzae TaxID=2034155 RepID=A0A1S8CF77_9GAMM|nr:hypothetical protein [Serratia oryzae]OMQ19938.1 hypothetical protein BMI79_20880 [Serratia oryzae]